MEDHSQGKSNWTERFLAICWHVDQRGIASLRIFMGDQGYFFRKWLPQWGQLLSIFAVIHPIHTHHRLIDNQQKESDLLMLIVLVPNDVPTWGSGRRNFISPCIKFWVLKGLLSSDPFPTKLGPSSIGREYPWATTIDLGQITIDPTFQRTKWIGIEGNLLTIYPPNTWHPPWEKSGRFRIPHIHFHLNESKVMISNCGFGKSTHEFCANLHRFEFELFKVAGTSHPYGKLVCCIFVQANPYVWHGCSFIIVNIFTRILS